MLKKNEYWAKKEKDKNLFLDIDKSKKALLGFYGNDVVKVRITEIRNGK